MHRLRLRDPIDCPSRPLVHTEILLSESNPTLRIISLVIFLLCNLSIRYLLSNLDPNANGVGALALVEVVDIFLLTSKMNVSIFVNNAISTKRFNILSETSNSRQTTRCSGLIITLLISPKIPTLPFWTLEPVSLSFPSRWQWIFNYLLLL